MGERTEAESVEPRPDELGVYVWRLKIPSESRGVDVRSKLVYRFLSWLLVVTIVIPLILALAHRCIMWKAGDSTSESEPISFTTTDGTQLPIFALLVATAFVTAVVSSLVGAIFGTMLNQPIKVMQHFAKAFALGVTMGGILLAGLSNYPASDFYHSGVIHWYDGILFYWENLLNVILLDIPEVFRWEISGIYPVSTSACIFVVMLRLYLATFVIKSIIDWVVIARNRPSSIVLGTAEDYYSKIRPIAAICGWNTPGMPDSHLPIIERSKDVSFSSVDSWNYAVFQERIGSRLKRNLL